jgi:hypothetical protein
LKAWRIHDETERIVAHFATVTPTSDRGARAPFRPAQRHNVHERRFVTWTKAAVPIEIVQLILGHSSPTVTRLIYAHVMKKATAEQVEAPWELLMGHGIRGRGYRWGAWVVRKILADG